MTSLRDSFLNCVANLPTGQTTKREAFLERQCAELAQQNEELRRKLRLLSTSARGYPPLAASSGPSFSLTSLRAEGPVERKVSDTLTTNPGSRTDLAGLLLEDAETSPERGGVERSELAAIAVAAAAREEAYYHGSLVHVLIDNDTYTDRTKVTVRAPEHERLLANELSTLSGLGFVVLEAHTSTTGGTSESTFVVQNSLGHKVLEKPRLAAIEQRLQQRFCGEQGVHGVGRLAAAHFLGVKPPWPYELLEPEAPAPTVEASWLSTLATALRGYSSLGEVVPALAARLAAELLPEMTRMRLPAGSSIAQGSTGGEWLLLLEGSAWVACTAPSQQRERKAKAALWMTPIAPQSTASSDDDDSNLPAEPRGEVDARSSSAKGESLMPGSVVWELTTPAPSESTLKETSEMAIKWTVLSTSDGVTLRSVHLSTVRSRLAALRESLARKHSRVLADTPVFAPLETPRLLALCRRATLVEVPSNVVVLQGGEEPPVEGITDTTFGLVLTGDLQMCFSVPEKWRADNGLPPLLPLMRLGTGSTFGEFSAVTGLSLPAGVSMRTESGATLLCWPRDPSLLGELEQLVGDSRDHTSAPSLLESSWLARTPLGLLVDMPELAICLRPIATDELIAQLAATSAPGSGSAEAAGTGVRDTDLMVVVKGELVKRAHESAQMEVHLLTAENGGVPDKYAGGDALHGQLELVVAARLPSRCRNARSFSHALNDLGLVVHDATFSLDRDVDAYHVVLPAGDARPASERAKDLRDQIQALQSTVLRPGDGMLALSEDGTSRILRLAVGAHGAGPSDGPPQPPRSGQVAMLDLRAFATSLASGTSELAAQWRRFLACHAPSLQLDDGDSRGAGTGGDVPGGGRGGWHETLCSFSLFRMRQQTSEPELGVEFSDLELGLKLGEGGFGEVHLARHRVSGALFAVKSFTKARIRRIEERTTYIRLERERKTLRRLQAHLRGTAQPHNLSRLICSTHDHVWLRLVLPVCLGGDMGKLLDEMGKLSDNEVQFYAGCVILALTHLHSLQIAYRDLKPENVLLTAAGWPVLTDFGLVAFLDDGPATSMVGTPEFMPPEIVAGASHGTDADWWSLGVMLCEMLTLATPFRVPGSGSNYEKTYANIVRGTFTREFEHKSFRLMQHNTAAMIRGLLKVDPQERLGGSRRGTESIRVHAFFWGLSWETLEARELQPPHQGWCSKHGEDIEDQFRLGGAEVPTVGEAETTGGAAAEDAAAAALDKMFDFSEW